MCALECPSNVNIPKLMLEAKSKYRAGRPGAPVDAILGRAELVSRMGRLASPLANPLMNQGLLRRVGEKVAGIDRRRTLPSYASKSYAQMLAARAKGAVTSQVAWAMQRSLRPACRRRRRLPRASPRSWAATARQRDRHRRSDAPPATGRGGAVAFFYDLYANYNDPALAQTMDNLLRAHGVTVHYPDQKGCAVPEMLYGYYDRAAQTAAFNVAAALPLHPGRRLPGERRADGQLRVQGALPGLRAHGGVRVGGQRHPRPGRVPGRPPGRPSRPGARAHRGNEAEGRLSSALPPQDPGDRDALLRPLEGDPRPGAGESRRRLLRHGRDVRHEGGHLRSLHGDRPTPLRAGGRRWLPT